MRSRPSLILDRAALLVLGLVLSGSCAAPRGEVIPLSTDHPAHPQADPGWFVDVGATLTAPSGAAPSSGVGAGGGDEQVPTTVQQRTYACPMHPDVKSNMPGTCSICGMQLEEVKPKHSVGEASDVH